MVQGMEIQDPPATAKTVTVKEDPVLVMVSPTASTTHVPARQDAFIVKTVVSP